MFCLPFRALAILNIYSGFILQIEFWFWFFFFCDLILCVEIWSMQFDCCAGKRTEDERQCFCIRFVALFDSDLIFDGHQMVYFWVCCGHIIRYMLLILSEQSFFCFVSFVLILLLKPLRLNTSMIDWQISREHAYTQTQYSYFVADTRHRNRIQFKRVFVFRTGRRLTVGVFSYRWSSMIICFFFSIFSNQFIVIFFSFVWLWHIGQEEHHSHVLDLFCSFFMDAYLNESIVW